MNAETSTAKMEEVMTPFILKFVEQIETGSHASTTSNTWGDPADSSDTD